ncbi:MAG: hypothetical protein AB8G77_05575 [Rhodothermales bacterium]
MTQDTEIRYHKFFIDANQQLMDLPAFHRLKKNGWNVAWSYQKRGEEGLYIETLLQRSFEKQASQESVL